jgi:NitT/TauT family transport system substrate-binding protein
VASARIAAALAAVAIAVAGCGGDDDSSGGGGGDGGGVATVKVSTIPTAAAAPLFVGIDRGYFKEENLRVETQFAEGGAAIIPAVQSGGAQFGFGNTVSLFLAREKGLNMPMVAAGQVAPEDEADDETAVMVPGNSDVREPADLNGAPVGANTLQNIATLSMAAGLDEEGGDGKSLKFTEVGFPEALPAIKSGDVKAAFFGEPFTTLAAADGARVIYRPFSAGVPGGQIGAYFASEKYVEENRDVVDRFARAIEKSNKYVIENPDAVRDSVVKIAKVPRKVADDMRLPVFVPTLDQEGLQSLADTAQEYGVIKEPLDTSEMVLAPR